MAHSIELVHRFRPWRAVWRKKIDPKAGQHEEPGDEDEPIRSPPPDASRNRIFTHRNRDLLLPSKNERIVHPSLAIRPAPGQNDTDLGPVTFIRALKPQVVVE